MKLKYYLRGIGIGLILTTLILTISNNMKSGTNADNSTVAAETTGSVLAYTTQASTEATQSDTKQSTTAAETTTASNTTTSAESTKADSSQSATVEKGQTIDVKLENIDYASMATHTLYEAGIIDDEDAFNAYLLETGDALMIQEGDYSIKAGDSYENIAKIITNIK